MQPTRWRILLLIAVLEPIVSAADEPPPLTVVEDLGGVSALPYYRVLKLQPPPAHDRAPFAPSSAFTEASALPVRSTRLTPGLVAARPIRAPGLMPLFIIGDDSRSREWLRRHAARLHQMNAVGVVVNVATAEALHSLRLLAPGLPLSPADGDDLAQRLDITHYPLLITATAIEQ